MRQIILLAFLSVFPAFLFAQSQPPAVSSGPQTFKLPATPKTVAWGYYDAAAPPVLHIHSGDTVVFDTLLTNSPTGLERAGVPPEQVQQSLRDIYKEVTNKGPGGHILNGPVYVEEAEPGDTLEVRIQKIELAIPYAYHGFGPNRGFLPEDFPYRKIKTIPLDKQRMIATFAPGIEIPLRPFFGSMGVAPPESFGRIDSAPPGVHAGNMHNKELVAGSTLYLTRVGRYLKWAMATPARATARWISRRWKLRWSARFNLWCGRTCTCGGHGRRRRRVLLRWGCTKI